MTWRRLALLGVLLLGGCKAVPQIAAFVTGGAAGVATGSPAVGFLVAVATDSAANAAVKYYGRSRAGSEQDAIAEAAGDLPIGGRATWRIRHTIPIGNEHGTLHVVRAIANPLSECKEVIFSVESGEGEKRRQAWYDADVCRTGEGWRWASAEPAVPRWGYLQ